MCQKVIEITVIQDVLVCNVTVVCVCFSPAQQEAQRAQFYVEKAKQDQRQKIIQAEGEAQAAKMVSRLNNHFLSHLSIMCF